MNKIFLLAGFTTILFACNSHSDNYSTHTDSTQAAHTKPTSNPKNQNNMNAITQTMDKMMHDMHGMKATGNNNIDFAAMMVEHHKGAVEMSKVEIDKGNNPEMKAFAQKVINDQDKEIAFMQKFIGKSPKISSPNSAEFQNALNHSMMAMMEDETPMYKQIE